MVKSFFQVRVANEILMYYRGNKKNAKNVSIYENIGFDKEGNEITILDVIKTKDPEFIEEIHKKDSINLLKQYMNVLNKREKDIIIMRYGLDGNDEITQKEIAKTLGISRSYVSRIEKRATTKILKECRRRNKITDRRGLPAAGTTPAPDWAAGQWHTAGRRGRSHTTTRCPHPAGAGKATSLPSRTRGCHLRRMPSPCRLRSSGPNTGHRHAGRRH